VTLPSSTTKTWTSTDAPSNSWLSPHASAPRFPEARASSAISSSEPACRSRSTSRNPAANQAPPSAHASCPSHADRPSNAGPSSTSAPPWYPPSTARTPLCSATARWASEPIGLGGGSWRSLVIGPEGVPIVTDAELAAREHERGLPCLAGCGSLGQEVHQATFPGALPVLRTCASLPSQVHFLSFGRAPPCLPRCTSCPSQVASASPVLAAHHIEGFHAALEMHRCLGSRSRWSRER
jgi:hypothetical protein